MKGTGIIKRVDDLGRFVIPKEIRRTLGITDGTPMEIYTDGRQIILKKYIPETDLSEMIGAFEEQLEDMCVDLGPEKTGDIRRHIRGIRTVLNKKI